MASAVQKPHRKSSGPSDYRLALRAAARQRGQSRARRMAAVAASWPALSSFLSPLQQNSILPLTAQQYLGAFSELQHWAAARSSDALLGVAGPAAIDSLLVLFFEDLHSNGAEPSTGSRTLAALLHLRPELGTDIKSAFPRAVRALRGWTKLMPAMARQPLPFTALLAMVTALVAQNQIAMGLCLLVGFSAYLRPRELTGLKVYQLLPPVKEVQAAQFTKWSIVLFPGDGIVKSKTGQWDESVELDHSWLLWAGPFLAALVRHRKPHERLWPFSHEQLLGGFRRAAVRTRVDLLPPASTVCGVAGPRTTACQMRGPVWTSSSAVGGPAQPASPATARPAARRWRSCGCRPPRGSSGSRRSTACSAFEHPDTARSLLGLYGL